MLANEKHERAYIIFLSSVTAKVPQLPQPLPFGYGQEAVALCSPDSVCQTLRAEGCTDMFRHPRCGMSMGTCVLYNSLSHSHPLHISPDWGPVHLYVELLLTSHQIHAFIMSHIMSEPI